MAPDILYQLIFMAIFPGIPLACLIAGVWLSRKSVRWGYALIVAPVGGVVGLLGPFLASWAMQLSDNPQLGLLSIFITGPIGFVLGGVTGLVCGILAERNGKRWILLPGLLIVAIATLGGSFLMLRSEPSQKRSGFQAPDFALPDISGKVVRLSDYRGKVVVINFWASWCGPCRMEAPTMEQLYRKYRSQGLVVLGLDRESPDNPEARAYARQTFTYPVLLGADDASAHYSVRGIPCTFVIDRRGLVVNRHDGYGPQIPGILEDEVRQQLTTSGSVR